MARWGTTTLLEAAPERVWSFLTDDTNDVNWRRPWVESVRKLTDGPLRAGTRYETRYRFFGREERVIVEITELDDPRRMAWRQVDSETIETNVGAYDLEPMDGGRTRFSAGGELRSRGWRAIADGPFSWYLNHGPTARQHRQLAAALRSYSRTLGA